MKVYFDCLNISNELKDEIDGVLHRIDVSGKKGCWESLPDEIRVLRKLSGGRSGCEVFQIEVKRDNKISYNVLKLGPIHKVKGEFDAYINHLFRYHNIRFAPIRAATPGVFDENKTVQNHKEAVLYDHVSGYVGAPHTTPRTFEDISREALKTGGPSLKYAIQLLEKLFEGIQETLYRDYKICPGKKTLYDYWNRKLGINAVIEVTKFKKRTPSPGMLILNNLQANQVSTVYPRQLYKASIGDKAIIKVGDTIKIEEPNLIASWWGDRLICELESHQLRIEIVLDDCNKKIADLKNKIKEGTNIHICGKIIELRAAMHKNILLKGLDKLFDDNDLIGCGDVNVLDPFAPLPEILDNRKSHIVTSLIHGDLNPTNILVVGDTPCLIDYALTAPDETIFSDFVRLEGCLTRDVLPKDFTWKEHVKLQRMLYLGSLYGDQFEENIAVHLLKERTELALAFQLFSSIRKAASKIYPTEIHEEWLCNYMEQLFLFAHLTLKWKNQSTHSFYATATMGGVAAETFLNIDNYWLWPFDEVRVAAKTTLMPQNQGRTHNLRHLSNFALALNRQFPKINKDMEAIFENIRADLVRGKLGDRAYKILTDLKKDHNVYISLKAFIDLEGCITEGRERQQLSFDEVLSNDETLIEVENLKNAGTPHDVLNFIQFSPELVLIGDAGSGKSTVAREWEFRLASSVKMDNQILPRIPIIIRAPDIQEKLRDWNPDDSSSTANVVDFEIDYLIIGAIHLTVDALNELDEEQKQRVAEWIVKLREFFPRTPVLVCHRQYNYPPGFLPFPVVSLQKINKEQAINYIYSYLCEHDIKDHEKISEALVRILFEDTEYEQVQDLAQTPLFLWMIVERYKETQQLPENRGQLFSDFSYWYLEERHHKETLPGNHEKNISRKESSFPESKSKRIEEIIKKLFPNTENEISNESSGQKEIPYYYDDKAVLLGVIGNELVQRSKTEIPIHEVSKIIPARIKENWKYLFAEAVLAEMLLVGDGKLLFMHQSFQEYFAARYFFENEAKNKKAIENRMRQHSWHDTFIILIGFAGDETQLVADLIEVALELNPVLTARCLRVAEQPDKNLLAQFVKNQETILNNPVVGKHSHQRSAMALFEHGQGPSREALLRVAANNEAPIESRMEVLKTLSKMTSQKRFVPVSNEIKQELEHCLEIIFNQSEPIEIKFHAIEFVVATKMTGLSSFLLELLREEDWSLQKAAWEACKKLSLKFTPSQKQSYMQSCLDRLPKTEKKLFSEKDDIEVKKLNEERIYILNQLTQIEFLPQLLIRRFDIGLSNKIKPLIDVIIDKEGDVPEEAQTAFSILKEPLIEQPAQIDRWFNTMKKDDMLAANAAAHRIELLGDKIPESKLEELIDREIALKLFDKTAELIKASRNKNLIKPLDELISEMINNLSFNDNEGLTILYLVNALSSLDGKIGLKAYFQFKSSFIIELFPILRAYSILTQSSPPSSISDTDEIIAKSIKNEKLNFDALLYWDTNFLLTGGTHHSFMNQNLNNVCDIITETLKQCDAKVIRVKTNIALLAAIKKDFSSMAKIMRYVEESKVSPGPLEFNGLDEKQLDGEDKERKLEMEIKFFIHRIINDEYRILRDDSFGKIEEHSLAIIFRVIGFLARESIKQQNEDIAGKALKFLENYYSKLPHNIHRSITVGLTTALGYMGKWEPILSHLDSGEPWMHKAVENIFKYWVPQIPEGKAERERAAIWIVNYIKTQDNLPANVRSTLEILLETLEREIGHHVLASNAL